MSVTTMLMAASVIAQGPAPTISTGRDGEIWSHAQARIEQQMDVWFESGDYPKVIQLLKVERDLTPHDYEVATNLGWMQENVEDYPSAIKTYERYIADNPNSNDAELPLAQLYFRQKKYALVPPLLEKTVKRTPPPHGNVWRILAHSYERTNRLKESERVWLTYLKVDPNDAPAKVNLARVQKKLGSK